MDTFLFMLFGLAACGGAVAVVISQNVVRMAFWLVIALGSTAGLFFLLGADFVGAVQLLIYVGGTVVLLIFGVMLTASGPFLSIKSSPADLALAAGVGGLLLGMLLAFAVFGVDWQGTHGKLQREYDPAITAAAGGFNERGEGQTVRHIGAALLGARFDRDLGVERAQPSTGYLLPFEIISVHLLVVLIGAAYLARAKRRVREPLD